MPPPVASKAIITTNVVIPVVVHLAFDAAPGEWKEKNILTTGGLPSQAAPQKVHGNNMKNMMKLTNLERHQREADNG